MEQGMDVRLAGEVDPVGDGNDLPIGEAFVRSFLFLVGVRVAV